MKHLFPYSLIVAGLFLTCCNSSSSDALSEWKEQSDFAVKDTAAIDRFTISDTENNSITISRKEDGKTWKIEGSDYDAQVGSVNLLLETFYRIRVKRDVPERRVEHVLSSLSARAKKVEIFTKHQSKPEKIWFVGGSTQDREGTFMLLQTNDNLSPVPFVMYKPGIYASMDVRFFTSWVDWRASHVFKYPDIRDISSIQVDFLMDTSNSYKIKRAGSDVSLFNGSNEKIEYFDTIQAKHYFSHYKKIHYNRIILKQQDFLDSVFNSACHYNITLIDKNNKSTFVELWKIKSNEDWDPEYGYIRVDGKNELLRIQFYSWDILFKPLSYFIKSSS